MMATVASALVVKAPVRAADLGGWSDTWFAGRGRVCNVAVSPGVVVRVTPSGARRTTLELSALGQQFELEHPWSVPGHPMIAAIVAAHPPGVPVHIEISSEVPSGSGMGTSAAVAVALLAALRALEGVTVDIHALAVEERLFARGGIRWVFTAGAPMPDDLRRWYARQEIPVCEGAPSAITSVFNRGI